MTTPEQPKLPPRKPVELPPIDRTPVDDTSNAAYSALTPRQQAARKSASAANAAADNKLAGGQSAEEQPAEALAAADATTTAAEPASPFATPASAPTGLGLSRTALIASVLLSLTAAVLVVVFSVGATPAVLWPLYLGASIGAVAALLAALARRHRGWIVALLLAVAVVVGSIVFAFVVG